MQYLFKALRAVRRARFLDFCIIFDTFLRPWSVFWSHFCYFIIILGGLWQHFLHQGLDWSAKAATGGAKRQNANIKSPFWTPRLTHFRYIFKTSATFFMSFRGDVLVMLSWCICVFFLTIFPPVSCAMWSVPEVIWTAQAWPKHMFWLVSAPRNNKKQSRKV